MRGRRSLRTILSPLNLLISLISYLDFRAGIPTTYETCKKIKVLFTISVSCFAILCLILCTRCCNALLSLLLAFPGVTFFLYFIVRPLVIAETRIRAEETELPLVVMLLSSVSSLRPLDMLRELNQDVFKITHEIRLLDRIREKCKIDESEAINILSKYHPSSKISKFLLDLMSAEFLSSNYSSYFKERVRFYLRDIESYLYSFDTMAFSLMDIIFNLLITIQIMFVPILILTGLPLTLLAGTLTLYPVIVGMVALAISTTFYPRILSPTIRRKDNAILILLLLIILTLSLLSSVIELPLYLLALSLLTLVCSTIAFLISLREKRLLNSLPVFIKDLIELYKSGYPLDVAVLKLADSNSQKYSKYLRKILISIKRRAEVEGFSDAVSTIISEENMSIVTKYVLETIRLCSLYGTSSQALEGLLDTLIMLNSVKNDIERKAVGLLINIVLGLIIMSLAEVLVYKYIILPFSEISQKSSILLMLFQVSRSILETLPQLFMLNVLLTSISISFVIGKIREGKSIVGLKYLPFTLLSSIFVYYFALYSNILDSLFSIGVLP